VRKSREFESVTEICTIRGNAPSIMRGKALIPTTD
jgi:hypothetical protein